MATQSSSSGTTVFAVIVRQVCSALSLRTLKLDVENNLGMFLGSHLKTVVQEARKIQLLSKSQILTSDHVNQALEKLCHDKVYNVQKSIDFRSSSFSSIGKRKVSSCLVSEVNVDLKNYVRIPLPRCPISPGISYHWLSVRNQQPRIPENPIMLQDSHASFNLVNSSIIQPSAALNTALIHGGVESRPLLEHVISLELQTYLNRIVSMLDQFSDESLAVKTLNSLATDLGLQPIVPHLVHYLYSRVKSSLTSKHVLISSLSATASLLRNPHVKLDLYLHQVLPTVISCVITNRLVAAGGLESAEHLAVRRQAAVICETIVTQYSDEYPDLLRRVMKSYVSVLSDPSSSLPALIGALFGLQLLGDKCCVVLCSHLPALFRRAMSIYDDDEKEEESGSSMVVVDAVSVTDNESGNTAVDNNNRQSRGKQGRRPFSSTQARAEKEDVLSSALIQQALTSLLFVCKFQTKIGDRLSLLKSDKIKQVMEKSSDELGEEFVPYFVRISNSSFVRCII